MRKSPRVTKTVLGFGAAMAAVNATPDLMADIVDLSLGTTARQLELGTFTVSNAALFALDPSTADGFTNFQIYAVTFGTGGDRVFSLFAPSTTNYGYGSQAFVTADQSIAPGLGGTSTLSAIPLDTQVRTVAFTTPAGNAGYYQVQFDAATNTLNFTPGQFGNEGEVIRSAAVPEPSSAAALGLLAAGALGVRRRRKQMAA